MSKVRYRKYPMPAGCDASEVVMRTLVSADEIEAAIMADSRMSKKEASSPVVALTMEKKESVRLSLVMIDGRRVNTDGEPCMEIDEWSQQSWTALYAFHNDMNGIPSDELGNCLKAGADVRLDEPNPSPKAAATGK